MAVILVTVTNPEHSWGLGGKKINGTLVVVDGYALAHSHVDWDLWSRLVDVLWDWFRGGRVKCVVVLRRGCGGVVES